MNDEGVEVPGFDERLDALYALVRKAVEEAMQGNVEVAQLMGYNPAKISDNRRRRWIEEWVGPEGTGEERLEAWKKNYKIRAKRQKATS